MYFLLHGYPVAIVHFNTSRDQRNFDVTGVTVIHILSTFVSTTARFPQHRTQLTSWYDFNPLIILSEGSDLAFSITQSWSMRPGEARKNGMPSQHSHTTMSTVGTIFMLSSMDTGGTSPVSSCEKSSTRSIGLCLHCLNAMCQVSRFLRRIMHTRHHHGLLG